MQSDLLLTVAMPVYNGQNFIAAALQSILDQSFRDFKIVIFDNGSTDATAGICRSFEDLDSRVEYRRSEINRGASINFNRAFRETTGKYFKWAAHDDELHPDYIKKCLNILEEDEAVALCHSVTEVIDCFGETLCIDHMETSPLRSDDITVRLRHLIRNDVHCYEVFGIIRRCCLAQTSLIGPYVASDRILRVELGLRGPFAFVKEPLFRNRHHADRSICRMAAHHQRGGWFHPRLEGKETLSALENFPGVLAVDFFISLRETAAVAVSSDRCRMVME